MVHAISRVINKLIIMLHMIRMMLMMMTTTMMMIIKAFLPLSGSVPLTAPNTSKICSMKKSGLGTILHSSDTMAPVMEDVKRGDSSGTGLNILDQGWSS